MYEKLSKEMEPNVFIAEGSMDRVDFFFEMKYPHTRIRGKKVTPEQAIEILARTEQFFMWHDYYQGLRDIEPEFQRLDVEYFCNRFFTRGIGIGNYGFIHPDGAIGLNTHLDKYATPEVLIDEAKELMKAFPYLDMIIAVATWNYYPPEYWDGTYEVTPDMGNGDPGSYLDKNLWDYADFENAIECCIHFKEGKIYCAFDELAREMYHNYDVVNEDRFFDDYNVTNQTVEYGKDVFKKCFAILGKDYEEYNQNYRDAEHIQDEYNIDSCMIPMSLILNPKREDSN